MTIPIGFSHGIEFAEDGFTPIAKSVSKDKKEENAEVDLPEIKLGEDQNVVNLMNLLNQEHDILGLWNESDTEQVPVEKAPVIQLKITQSEEEEDSVIPKASSRLLVLVQIGQKKAMFIIFFSA